MMKRDVSLQVVLFSSSPASTNTAGTIFPRALHCSIHCTACALCTVHCAVQCSAVQCSAVQGDTCVQCCAGCRTLSGAQGHSFLCPKLAGSGVEKCWARRSLARRCCLPGYSRYVHSRQEDCWTVLEIQCNLGCTTNRVVDSYCFYLFQIFF